MKFSVLCILIIFLIFIPFHAYAIEQNNFQEGLPYPYMPAEGSIEELYKDMLVTLLAPSISKEIEKFYGQTLQYDMFDVEFLQIKRPSYRSFTFIVTLQVKPFIGAHNIIGIDRMTIVISPSETKVSEFEHIKSFPIPPHLNKHNNSQLPYQLVL